MAYLDPLSEDPASPFEVTLITPALKFFTVGDLADLLEDVPDSLLVEACSTSSIDFAGFADGFNADLTEVRVRSSALKCVRVRSASLANIKRLVAF